MKGVGGGKHRTWKTRTLAKGILEKEREGRRRGKQGVGGQGGAAVRSDGVVRMVAGSGGGWVGRRARVVVRADGFIPSQQQRRSEGGVVNGAVSEPAEQDSEERVQSDAPQDSDEEDEDGMPLMSLEWVFTIIMI